MEDDRDFPEHEQPIVRHEVQEPTIYELAEQELQEEMRKTTYNEAT